MQEPFPLPRPRRRVAATGAGATPCYTPPVPEQPADLRNLEALLGHRFRDPDLLRRALTHPSAGAEHNERLEFLGDAVLGLVAVGMLCARFPAAREGRLTRLKARLVARATLARAASRLGLERWLRVGGGLRVRGTLPPSALGNAFEAVAGALWLDAGPARGVELAEAFLLRGLGPELDSLEEDLRQEEAKQLLQELTQARLGVTPTYNITDSYHDHPETDAFEAVAEVAGRRFPPAWGTTKKEAERRAAWEALRILRRELEDGNPKEDGEDDHAG